MGRNFEKLIEYIVNSDEQRARKLFHQIVVSKSRSIYESMENDMDDIMQEVDADETSMMEADFESEDDNMDMGDADMGDADMGDMPLDMDEEPAETDEMESRVDDLESAIDELKAEFEKLMSDENDADMDDADMDDEDMDDADMDDEDMDDEDMDDEEGEGIEETIIREYTEKAPKPVTSEEGSTNKKSTVAGKNDMGGTTANIAKGGDAKGRTAPSAKPMGVNDPKAAGKSAFKSHAPKPATKETAGTNKDSVLESRRPRNKK